MNPCETGHSLGLDRSVEPLPPAAWRREAVLVLDQAGRVVDWNAAATLLFGRSREQALGREVAVLLVPEERREEVRRRWLNLLASTAADPERERSFEDF